MADSQTTHYELVLQDLDEAPDQSKENGNMNILDSALYAVASDAVHVSEQELTAEQQAQVRQNIDVPASSELGWTFLQSQSGETSVTVPVNAREYLVVARYGIQTGDQSLSFTFNIPVSAPSGLAFTNGYYLSNSNAFCQITFTKSTTYTITLSSLIVSGLDYKSTSKLYVWYR